MAQWREENHSLEVYDPNTGVWSRLCDAFGIAEVSVDLLSGQHSIRLYVDSSRSGYNRSPPLARKALCRNSIMGHLYDVGLGILDSEEDVPIVQEILLTREANAPLFIRHQQLGFARLNGREFFLLDTPIGLDDPIKASSRYYIPDVLTPRGTLASWKAMVQSEVLGHPALELALAVGAVAPVAHLLREQRVITDLPVIAYIGHSSTAKTTAMRLGASLWGLPLEGEGIIDDLNSTENAFFASLARNVGVPSFIDETSAQPTWDFGRMLYFLPKGKAKLRCNGDGELRKASAFSGAVIFTGERSLLEQTQKNAGLFARIVEFSIEKWAKDGEHAERLTEQCLQNYGTAAPVLAQWLMKNGHRLAKAYGKECERFLKLCGNVSGVERRIIKILAMIMVSARVLRTALDLKMDLKSIRSLLCEQLLNGREERDKVALAYDKLLSQIAANGTKFIWAKKGSTSHPLASDVWGVFEYHESTPCVWITRDRFEKMLAAANVHDRREILGPFKARDWIVQFPDRHYFRPHLINGVKPLACCLLLPDVPDLFNRLEKLPANATSAMLTEALRGRSFNATVLSSQTASDTAFKEAVEAPDERASFAMVHPSAQSGAVLLNKPLLKQLKVKNAVYAAFVADEGLLLLSTEPLGQSSRKITLKAHNDDKLNDSLRLFKFFNTSSKSDLKAGEGIAFYDITIKQRNGHPLAVITLALDSAIDVVRGQVRGWEFPKA